MNKGSLNTISLNKSSLNVIGEVKMGGASGGGGGGGLDAIGVFIYDIDGKLTAPEDWNTANNDKAVGVYLGTDVHRFVIAKSTKEEQSWGGTGKRIISVPNNGNGFDGKGDTSLIIEELADYTDSAGIVGAPACEESISYSLPNGEKGYLPSYQELLMIYNNADVIRNALGKCGGNKYLYLASSSPYNEYVYYYNNKSITTYSRSSKLKVRPIFLV